MACNIELFDIHETEHALCIDGVINKFMFQLDVLTNDLTAYNLWAFEDPNRKSFDGKREKADAVLKVFNEIKEVLLNNGVNSKYLDLYNWGTIMDRDDFLMKSKELLEWVKFAGYKGKW